MIPTIIIVVIAFAWLLIETDFMRIRLETAEYQKSKALQSKTEGIRPALNDNIPVILALPEVCELTRIQREFQHTKYQDSWRYGTSYNTRRKTSYQQMTIGNQTITLEATYYKLYDLIKEISRVQTEKPRKPVIKTAPLPNFISMVETGNTHEVTDKWIANNGKEYSSTYTTKDYKPEFHNCLIPKSWLTKHYKDEYPEPLIELLVNDKTLSVNGDYKKGMIRDFVKANKS